MNRIVGCALIAIVATSCAEGRDEDEVESLLDRAEAPTRLISKPSAPYTVGDVVVSCAQADQAARLNEALAEPELDAALSDDDLLNLRLGCNRNLLRPGTRFRFEERVQESLYERQGSARRIVTVASSDNQAVEAFLPHRIARLMRVGLDPRVTGSRLLSER